jgi:hypothetical protein
MCRIAESQTLDMGILTEEGGKFFLWNADSLPMHLKLAIDIPNVSVLLHVLYRTPMHACMQLIPWEAIEAPCSLPYNIVIRRLFWVPALLLIDFYCPCWIWSQGNVAGRRACCTVDAPVLYCPKPQPIETEFSGQLGKKNHADARWGML